MYETIILIDPTTEISADEIQKALSATYPTDRPGSPSVARRGPSFSVQWPDFNLELHLSSLPHVLEESGEMAGFLPESSVHREGVSSCRTRIEISGADDPGMSYFNDFCYVIEAIENLGKVYTFDQGSAQFMNL